MKIRAKRGFTLVELLVVIGIITVLMGILLPVLGRARESGRQASCLNNLKQLGAAFTMYVDSNKGSFPARASKTAAWATPYDWIYWNPAFPGAADLSSSPIVSYLGGTPGTYFNPAVFRCPSDDYTNRPLAIALGIPPFPYSYTMDFIIGGAISPSAREPMKISQIYDPTDKILLLCADENDINDGNWVSTNDNISTRHDFFHGTYTQGLDKRGNALFCDSHAEFIPKAEAEDPQFYDPRVSN